MTLRYPSATDPLKAAEPQEAVLSRIDATRAFSSGAKMAPPPVEYVPVEVTYDLEDKMVALGRLDPELEEE
ncbi:hypothetical protein [Rhizobium binae]|uniref:hypothetical protein n=1 Tax=Rhizobium binae TaxID=1138190 RepID=UPI001C830C6B|nr:hypothetical protein [Rhizobium binae]MBX4967715.1 hypothetical protein [Rhizobium binae]